MILIDGAKVARQIRAEIKTRIASSLKTKISLAVILVGSDPASKLYVRLKRADCAELGIESKAFDLPGQSDPGRLDDLIDELNADDSVDGILVQLPLPEQFDARTVVSRVSPLKDVDGFHPFNRGLLSRGSTETLAPCTPAGCIELLDRYAIPIEGARAVVVGRSEIVGKPIAMMLLNRNATVTVAHSKTVDLPELTRSADILIAALGRARFITGEMVKDGVVALDVGINRLDDGKLIGDIDFDAVAPKARAISPVPGGVGPMTRAALMSNTLRAAMLRRGLNL